MVIDHYNVGFLRFSPGARNKTGLKIRTVRAETIIGSGSYERPQFAVFSDNGGYREITVHGDRHPLFNGFKLGYRIPGR